jgi:hypothetical protein
MYLWRGKNKRDEHFQSQKQFANAGVQNERFDLSTDDQVRLDLEEEHIDYFHDSIATTLRKYLKTDRGKIEVEYIRKELGKVRLADPEYAQRIKETVPKKPSELAAEKAAQDAAAAAAMDEVSIASPDPAKGKKAPPTKAVGKDKRSSLLSRFADVFSSKQPLAVLHPELLVDEKEARDMIIENAVRKYATLETACRRAPSHHLSPSPCPRTLPLMIGTKRTP